MRHMTFIFPASHIALSAALVFLCISPALLIATTYELSSANLVAASRDGVVVELIDDSSGSYRLLMFAKDGTFLKEIPITISSSLTYLAGISEDEHLWLISMNYGDESTTLHEAIVSEHSPEGKFIRSRPIPDDVSFFTGNQALYLATQDETSVDVKLLDWRSGKLSDHFLLNYDEISNSFGRQDNDRAFTIDSQGNFLLLIELTDEVVIRAYSPSGAIRFQERFPAQGASIQSIKSDSKGSIYAFYSVESEVDDEEILNVIALNRDGKKQRTIISESVYGDNSVIDGEQNLYVQTNDGIIEKFSSDGTRKISWNPMPPMHGDSWEDKHRREQLAQTVSETSSDPDLLQAWSYSSPQMKARIELWLSSRGLQVIPAFMHYLSRDPDEVLVRAMGRILDADETGRNTLEDAFQSASFELKKKMAYLFLFKPPKSDIGLPQLFKELAQSGDPGDRETGLMGLAQYGGIAEIYEKQIAALKKGALPEDEAIELLANLSKDFKTLFAATIPILEGPQRSPRSQAQTLLFKSALNSKYLTGYGSVAVAGPREQIEKLKKWSKSEDPFLKETGIISLACLGHQEYANPAINAAHDQVSLVPSVLDCLRWTSLNAKPPELSGKLVDATVAYIQSRTEPPEIYSHPVNHSFPLSIMKQLEGSGLNETAESFLFTWLNAHVETPFLAPEIITRIIDGAFFKRYYRNNGYLTALKTIAERHRQNDYVRESIRSHLLPLLPSLGDLECTENEYEYFYFEHDYDAACPDQMIVKMLRNTASGDDRKHVVPLIDSDSSEVRYSSLLFVAEGDCLEKHQDTLLRVMRNDKNIKNRVAAAAALARCGHPEALPLLINKGLKKPVLRDDLELTGEYFQHYGKSGEIQLLGLLDYPDKSTRETVRIILAGLNSRDARLRIQNEFNESLSSGKLPDGHLIASMMLYNLQPWDFIIDFKIKPSQCGYSFPDLSPNMSRKSLEYLTNLLLSTFDEEKAQMILALIHGLNGIEMDVSDKLQYAAKYHESQHVRDMILVTQGF